MGPAIFERLRNSSLNEFLNPPNLGGLNYSIKHIETLNIVVVAERTVSRRRIWIAKASISSDNANISNKTVCETLLTAQGFQL